MEEGKQNPQSNGFSGWTIPSLLPSSQRNTFKTSPVTLRWESWDVTACFCAPHLWPDATCLLRRAAECVPALQLL